MPLLDVVFLLLTFFAFALLLMVQARVLDVNLPVVEAGVSAGNAPEPIVVSITAEGTLAVDRQAVDDASLVERLHAKRDAADEPTLLLEVDVGAPSGRLIEVVQTLRGAGFERFGVLGSAEPSSVDAAAEP